MKEVSYVYQGCIYLIQKAGKNITVVKFYYNSKELLSIFNIMFNIFYSCDAKLHSTPLSVSHDPSEIIIIC